MTSLSYLNLPKIVEKLVPEEITDKGHVMVSLRRYVKKELCKGNEIMPSESDKSFYPTPKDISNHIYMTSQKNKFSKLDQQDLLHKINEWKQEDKEASYFLRYTK